MCDYCQWIGQLLVKINTAEESERKLLQTSPVIVVHGGAGEIPSKYLREYLLQEVKSAAVMAYEKLLSGCSSMDAVEQAVRRMECQNPYYSAVENDDRIVGDAAIMTSDYRAGSVGCVCHEKHPISLARKVLENTEDILIVGSGAEKLARDLESPIPSEVTACVNIPGRTADDNSSAEQRSNVNNVCRSFDSNSSMQERELEAEHGEEMSSTDLHNTQEYDEFIPGQFNGFGAVAFDRNRKLSSASSRREKSRKPSGSISATSAVIGCGIYVDEQAGVSVSGADRIIYKYALAYKIVRRIRQMSSASVTVPVESELDDFVKETDTFDVGAVVLNEQGDTSISFKSVHFPWACCRNGRVYYGCEQTDKFCEIIESDADVDAKDLVNRCMCVHRNV